MQRLSLLAILWLILLNAANAGNCPVSPKKSEWDRSILKVSINDFSYEKSTHLYTLKDFVRHAYSMLFAMSYLSSRAFLQLGIGAKDTEAVQNAKSAAWGMAWLAAWRQFPDEDCPIRNQLTACDFDKEDRSLSLGWTNFFHICNSLFEEAMSKYERFFELCDDIKVEDSLFCSKDAWFRFKTDALGADPEVLDYLIPWIEEIDRIVEFIDKCVAKNLLLVDR